MSFYEFLRTAPYVRLLIPFLLGILNCRLFRLWPGFIWMVPVFLAGMIILHVFDRKLLFRDRWIWGVLMFMTLWAMGFLMGEQNLKRTCLPDSKILVKGRIVEIPECILGNYHATVVLDGLYTRHYWQPLRAKVVCRLQARKISALSLNQEILMLGTWKEIKNYKNPGTFDYQGYMNRQGMFYTIFLDSCHWKGLGPSAKFDIRVWSLKLRERIVQYFRQLSLEEKAFGVITALTVGDKNYLNEEVNQAFVNSGTIHILAVSGMHVALLFWLLEQLTKPLLAWRKGKIYRAVVVLWFIWLYALITGLGPSVVRASVMFSFWMIGDSSRKQVNIFNTLSLSAFILLIIQPDTIYDVGFQLSYLAVLGIVIFYKDIYRLCYFKHKILQYFWSIIAVSFAAQLLTLPVTLYNFHQFPNYFILANLVAIPLSTLILYSAILALVLAPFHFLWTPVGWVLGTMVNGLNNLLEWIEHLPGALTAPVPFTIFTVLIVFGMVAFLRIFLTVRKFHFLIFFLILALGGGIERLYLKYKLIHKVQFVVFQTPSQLLIQFQEGGFNYMLTDGDSVKMARIVKPFNDKQGLGEPVIISPDYHGLYQNGSLWMYRGFISFKDQRVFVWLKNPKITHGPVKVDVLIIHHLTRKDLKWVKKMFTPREIIITSGVFPSYLKELKSEFMMNENHFWVLNADGARVWSVLKKNDE